MTALHPSTQEGEARLHTTVVLLLYYMCGMYHLRTCSATHRLALISCNLSVRFLCFMPGMVCIICVILSRYDAWLCDVCGHVLCRSVLEGEGHACVRCKHLELVVAMSDKRRDPWATCLFVSLTQVKEELLSRARAAAMSRTASGTLDEGDDAEGMLRYTLYHIWYGMVWYGMVWYGTIWYGLVVLLP